MTSHFEGQREHNFRERSTNPSMAGIGICATFRCAVCKKPKEAFGRKLLIKGYSKGGYKCADCVQISKGQGGIPDTSSDRVSSPTIFNGLERSES